jgi:dTDP-4-amino-4,6-dideoxygalactose transaminase
VSDHKPIVMCDLAAQRARLEPGLSQAIQRVLDHGQFILGPEVAQLEGELAQFCGAQHAVTCANGTDAIELVMMAEGIGQGDAVIVPSFTFVATAEAVATSGATPVFADVDTQTFNIDPSSVQRCLRVAHEEGLTTRAIVAVDLFGLPADYAALRKLAAENNALLIADAAQSFGAQSPLGAVGTLGDYTTTSFFPSKPLGCYGDGGAVFTNDSARADLLRSLRFHGKGSGKYDNVRVGMNSRLDTVQAAILLEKLAVFRDELLQRNAVAEFYSANLPAELLTPSIPPGFRSAWAQYTLRCEGPEQRRSVQTACEAHGIATAVYYPKALHQQTGYERFPRDPNGLSNSQLLAQCVLSIPMHPFLTRSDLEFIVGTTSSAIA